jgi:hypothetical protein
VIHLLPLSSLSLQHVYLLRVVWDRDGLRVGADMSE